jgi:hypothetical protein
VSTVTDCEDPEFAALDAYIRSQLAGAADAYASHIDVDARLKAVLEAADEDTRDDAAAADD